MLINLIIYWPEDVLNIFFRDAGVFLYFLVRFFLLSSGVSPFFC